MAFVLGPKDLEALLLGGCFFGSGGGGTVESARSLLKHFQAGDYYPTDQVRVVSVEEATDGESVMVAYLGAPAAIDSATYPLGPVLAVQQVQQRLQREGRKLAYLAPPESGALGFTVACLVAARLGLAVIDGDGAGRAVPQLPQLTYAAAEVDPRPAFLVSQGGLTVELDVTMRNGVRAGAAGHQQDVAAVIDQMMRPIVGATDFGEFGGLAMWIMTPSVLAGALTIRGTLTRALTLGRALVAGELRTAEQVPAYLKERFGLAARAIFPAGEIVSVKLDTSGGFDLGKVQIQSGGSSCTVLYQNESLLAWDSLQPSPICMAPDSIAYFVEGSGQAVYSNGDLLLADGTLNPQVAGHKVTLLGIAADPALRKPGGLILTNFMELLGTIGYLGPYAPLKAQHGGAQ